MPQLNLAKNWVKVLSGCQEFNILPVYPQVFKVNLIYIYMNWRIFEKHIHFYSLLCIIFSVMDANVIFLYLTITVPELNPSKMQ